MNIWTYWEGPKPRFVDLCLRSMQQAFRFPQKTEVFHIVTPKNLHKHIATDALHPNFHRLLEILGTGNKHMLSAIRAGCIRAALLAAHGGWWFDADTIGFQSPGYLVGQYENPSAIYTTWGDPNKPQRVLNGYIYVTRDVGTEWLQRLNQKLEEFESIKWCSMGEGILTPLLLGDAKSVRMPRELVLPLDIDSDVEAFFKPGDPYHLVTPDTICFGLNCSYMLYYHRKTMEPPWNQDLMIHRLLQQAKERLG